MDGDVFRDLNEILNSIYSSSNWTSEMNTLFEYLCTHQQEQQQNQVFNFLLSLLISRINSKFRKKLVRTLLLISYEKPELVPVLCGQLSGYTTQFKDIVPSKSISKTVYFFSKLYTAFKWEDLNDESKRSLIEAQSIFCLFYAKLKSKFFYEKNYKCLKKCLLKFPSNSFEAYLNFLKDCSSNSSPNNIRFSILFDNVIRFQIETNNLQFLDSYKSFISDLFVKNVILSKFKLTDQFDSFCFQHTLSQINKEEFQTCLFPSMQKTILRNPEISLNLMVLIIEYLNFDISDFLEDISKILGSYLRSKNELLQEESLRAVKFVSRKCFNSIQLEFAIKYFSKIYNGSEGKLTVLGQKQTIIKSIGNLSFNNSGSKQNLLNSAVTELLQIFKQETVESSFVLLFFQIKMWIKNSPQCTISDQFWKFIKDFSKSKSATFPVLASLYELLIALLTINNNNLNLVNVSKIEDNVLTSIINSSKNVSSPLTKIQVLIESLNASLLLLKIFHLNEESKEKMKHFLTSMCNLSAVTFLTDKFVSQATPETLFNLIDFIYCLICQIELDEENLSFIYKSCIYLMCHPSRQVRDKAIKEFQNYSLENEMFPIKLIRTFNEMYKEDNIDNHNKELLLQNGTFKLRCCQIMIKQCQIAEIQYVFDILQLSHHFFIFKINPKIFSCFLRKYLSEKQIDELIEYNFKNFLHIILESTFGEMTTLNIVKTMIQLAPHKFSNRIIEQIFDNLEQHLSEYKSISKENFEIYMTPKDQLYNRAAVIEANEVVDKNLKRENKLYSHKEQLAEIQLRKELEAKNAENNLNLNELNLEKMSKKQKEIYSQEMEKEKVIRDRLKFLYQQFSFYTNILLSIIETNQIVASIYFKEIIFTYVNLFSSILVFDKASEFFKTISRKMMISSLDKIDGEYSSYVDIICNAIIKLYKSDEQSPSQELINLIERIVNYIYMRTCPNINDFNEKLFKKANENRLTTSAFSFVFPLFRYILMNMNSNNDHYEKLVEKCLHIITQHAMIRCYTENDLENLKNPQNLPIKLILETLLKFMEKDVDVNCNELIASTFLHVISSVNIEIGCGKAATRDIFTLLNYLTHQDDFIRLTCFKALYILSSNVLPFLQNEHCKQKLAHRCFVGKFDILPDCRTYACKIFEMCNFETSPFMLVFILNEDIENINLVMTHPVSKAYKTLIEEYPTELEQCYEKLITFYQIKASSSIPSVDTFGRPLTKVHIDHFEPRLTIAYIFKYIVSLFKQNQVESFINFLIPQALSDNDKSVRSAMLDAGCQLIDDHGKNNITYFLNVFEKFLDSAPDDHQNDLVRKSVIILMGTLAKHIDNDNPKLKPILSKLVEALSTPSQIVQETVANCLQYLIRKFIDDAPALLKKLLEFLLESDTYGERKGAAYGIAGIIKGLGILSLNRLGIMNALTEAIQCKNKPNNREGALFAFEMLSHMLGRLFEPFIVHILPHLLDCFGDNNTRVRNAADDAAKVIMANLSAFGVTLIFPAILQALEDDSWRKKTSSIELLGSMAFCAPKQLSQCLPKIVPKLMAVLTDSHPKVQKSAAHALKQIGSVIKNPEIQEIVPILLDALQDPANKTNECLNVMMRMKFVHVIDPPSLALIMPVIERAFQNRSTETRKMASQIVGNMYALAKSKDFSPYLSSIIPGLKNSLLDPVPEVRTATARALGAMVRSLGNEILDDVRPWLERTLISETSSVDRSGAAQGLAEVLGGLGKEHLDKYMPKILEVTMNPDVPAYVKDGFIMLYIYLPAVFTQHFSSYINQVINPILKALADENEFVRETALRAGQRIVNMYADTAIQLLLPELERGLFDENWRIRFSSVQLLGDLLFKITGLSGKMTTESNHEDDNFGTEQSHQALFDALGEERRNRVLSGLYMGRSDVSLQVRQASLHVWKVIIPNTPRTLKEILPILFTLLLECLASNSSDRQQIGARTLGDLVRKLGERILPEILPILEDGLKSERPDQREGVCIGLSEIISSTSREMVQVYADSFIATIRKALFDSLPEVRQAAARTFDHLHSAIGEKVLSDIITHLLDNIDHPEKGERVLDSLKNIISYKSKVVLPNLIPKLITKPVNTRALAFISSVAGESLSKHLHIIIPPLLSSLNESDDDSYEEQLEYCQNVITSITDENGARSVILTLLDSSKSKDLNTKRAAVSLLTCYCIQAKPCLTGIFRTQILINLIDLLGSKDEFILNQSIEALNAIIKNLDTKQQLEAVPEVYKKLQSKLSEEFNNNIPNHRLLVEKVYSFPGFSSNKGIQSLLNLFNKALLSSSSDLKEQATDGYRLIVLNASSDALRPSVIGITGPLLRILADRLTPQVRILAIDILSILLTKVGSYLKQFFPQIQLVFFRSLTDDHRNVQLQAAICISRFSLVHTKPNSLLTELLSIIKKCSSENVALKEAWYYAIRLSVSAVGTKIDPTIHQQIYELASNEYNTINDSIRISAASLLGSLCPFVTSDLLEEISHKYLLEDTVFQEVHLRLFRCIALKIALKDAFENMVLKNENWSEMIHQTVISYINSNKTPLAINGLKCAAYIIHHSLVNNIVPKKEFLQTFSKSMNNLNNDVKQTVTLSTIFWSQNKTDIPVEVLKILVPHLVNGTKEKNTMVRAYSEQALIALLKLKQGDSEIYQKCMKSMESGAVESLQDCVAKIRKSMAKIDFKEEEFDDTLLMF